MPKNRFIVPKYEARNPKFQIKTFAHAEQLFLSFGNFDFEFV